jgi:hypothetical protein
VHILTAEFIVSKKHGLSFVHLDAYAEDAALWRIAPTKAPACSIAHSARSGLTSSSE